jgi:hypothetical protein
VDAESEHRIGRNEAIAREVNEAIESGKAPADVHAPIAFRCECGQLGCNQLFEVTLGDYERVRAHSRHFLVADGHEQPEVESVVQRRSGYTVVEKLDVAGHIADASDPRS